MLFMLVAEAGRMSPMQDGFDIFFTSKKTAVGAGRGVAFSFLKTCTLAGFGLQA